MPEKPSASAPGLGHVGLGLLPKCSIMRRLLDMRVSEGAEGVDVGKLCEAQPALLLQQGVQVGRQQGR